jgi:hypothetical protein
MREWTSSTRKTRPRPSAAALTIVVCGVLMGSSAAIAAETNHVFNTTFGAAGSVPSNPYPLGPSIGQIAVDNSGGPSDGDIYVVDQTNIRVEKFDPAGNLLLTFGKEVNKTKVETPGSTNAEENVCVIASGDECKTGVPAGAGKVFPDAFKTPDYIAVDNSSGDSSGDVYVGDVSFPDNYVFRFDSSGHLDESWADGGRLNTPVTGVQVDLNGDVLIMVFRQIISRRSETGDLLTTFELPAANDFFSGFALDSTEHLYLNIVDPEAAPKDRGIIKTSKTGGPIAQVEPESSGFTPGMAIDPATDDLYAVRGGGGSSSVTQYDGYCGSLCTPTDTMGESRPLGTSPAVGATLDSVYVPSEDGGETDIAVFEGVAPRVTGEAFLGADETTASVTAHVDPAGHGPITQCDVEYLPVPATKFTESVPCVPDPSASPPGSNFSGAEDVSAEIPNLASGSPYRFRVAVSNSAGASAHGLGAGFTTASMPTIESVKSSKVTATSAKITAVIGPRGADTSYSVEYGVTTDYGKSAPIPFGELTSGLYSPHTVSIDLAGLDPEQRYHFRVVAENKYGVTVSEDQSFGFYPPQCPNQALRQQTGASDLPDCRGYELVSPEDAGNASIFTSGSTPNTGRATNPPRLSFNAFFGVVPGSNGQPSNSYGDMYVATRTSVGWVSKYIGLPATEALTTGGPPYRSQRGTQLPDKLQRGVLADPNMSTVVDWNNGEYETMFEREYGYGGYGPGDFASNAPYVWDTNTGAQIDRWPTNVGAIPGGTDFVGEMIASADLSHLVFSSDRPFLPGAAAGDVYDNDTKSQSLTIVSRAQGGTPLEVSPAKASEDGSRILLSGPANPCGGDHVTWICPEPLTLSVELYMRVDDSITYELAPGHAVKYVGMTADASRVYFLSSEKLTSGDTDESRDLYMWSESKANSAEPLTLVSIGNGGTTGNGDDCEASWTERCDVVPITFTGGAEQQAGLGGNGITDSMTASRSGDIYFLSPERGLDGGFGVEGAPNLYLYQEGSLSFVAVLGNETVCTENQFTVCSETPVGRMNVSPDGQHAAFITRAQLTEYDNAGHAEMYRYDPASDHLLCVSCRPDGVPPGSDTLAAINGLFMADDGRTFFSTNEPLVPQDTNESQDVYEFTEGRPQLISSGTARGNDSAGVGTLPGLDAVSADGSDVYFATYDVLVGQDQNGEAIKIYDARSGGGFPFVKPPPGCAAADECHGPGSSPIAVPPSGTGAPLGDQGNLRAGRSRKGRHSRRKRHKRHGAGKHRGHRGEQRG